MPEHGVQIGMRYVWGHEAPFGLSSDDRHRHLYIIGQTGTGKSTLLRELITQDMRAGEGLALIDPHGDLADEVIDLVPRRRIDDVVVLDPSDTEHVVGFNPFYRVPRDERPLVAANLVATFRYVWRDSWGPRLEYILYNAAAAALDAPDHLRPNFLTIARLLVEWRFREALLPHVTDPRVVSFFRDEFAKWNERQRSEYLSSVQNKIGQVLANPFIRNVLAQWKPSLDLPAIMAERKILIVRVPKGFLGEDPTNLLGSLLVASTLQAAMRREDHADRVPFHLYLDEFQNFSTDAFATILAEARKYALTLTIAHQYLDQLPPSVRAAAFGNVGSLLSFRLGGADAEVFAGHIGTVPAPVYRDLARGRLVARLIDAGETKQPFTGWTVPCEQPVGCREKVIAKSRRAYARPRARVEKSISRWLRS